MTALVCSKHYPVFFFWESRDLQILKTREKLGCLETVRNLVDIKIVPVVSQAVERKLKQVKEPRTSRGTGQTPRRGILGWRTGQQNLKDWELCAIAAGLWEKHLGGGGVRRTARPRLLSPCGTGRDAQFRALQQYVLPYSRAYLPLLTIWSLQGFLSFTDEGRCLMQHLCT